MSNKVDFVLLYVNPNDPAWMADAMKHNIFELSCSAGPMRYQDDHTVELAVQSIRKYCPFAGDIYLVVSSESQVPEYLAGKVKVITHREFIPEEYLPTFSALTIEMFLPFLPNVSDSFVYMNDDMIFIDDVEYSDFFVDGKPLSTVYVAKNNRRKQFAFSINIYNLIMGKEQSLYRVETHHGPTPFRKAYMRECFEKYKQPILDSITPLRRTKKNFSQHLFSFYDFCYHFAGKSPLRNKALFTVDAYNSFDWATIGDYQAICLNTPVGGDITKYVELVKDIVEDKNNAI